MFKAKFLHFLISSLFLYLKMSAVLFWFLKYEKNFMLMDTRLLELEYFEHELLDFLTDLKYWNFHK